MLTQDRDERGGRGAVVNVGSVIPLSGAWHASDYGWRIDPFTGQRAFHDPQHPLILRQVPGRMLAAIATLGFGGAMTYERALRIRSLAAELPDEALVLETDAPDIAPVWLHRGPRDTGRNTPSELPRIAETLAALRSRSLADIAAMTTNNARAALPRLATLLDASL